MQGPPNPGRVSTILAHAAVTAGGCKLSINCAPAPFVSGFCKNCPVLGKTKRTENGGKQTENGGKRTEKSGFHIYQFSDILVRAIFGKSPGINLCESGQSASSQQVSLLMVHNQSRCVETKTPGSQFATRLGPGLPLVFGRFLFHLCVFTCGSNGKLSHPEADRFGKQNPHQPSSKLQTVVLTLQEASMLNSEGKSGNHASVTLSDHFGSSL